MPILDLLALIISHYSVLYPAAKRLLPYVHSCHQGKGWLLYIKTDTAYLMHNMQCSFCPLTSYSYTDISVLLMYWCLHLHPTWWHYTWRGGGGRGRRGRGGGGGRRRRKMSIVHSEVRFVFLLNSLKMIDQWIVGAMAVCPLWISISLYTSIILIYSQMRPRFDILSPWHRHQPGVTASG